jgi:glycosyltransferase involved in cell wall biosynthesis
VNFGIVTISNGRPKVLELFLASMRRLRKELDMFIPVVVVGDAEHQSLCEAYYVIHITQQNHPASRKWNTGVEYLMGQGVQYITILGSDDIASTDLVRNLIKAMEQDIDLISVSTIYFYAGDGRFKGTLKKLVTKQLLGVCRTIHRRVIDKTGKLWTRDRSWGMDGDCYRNISPHVQTRAIVQGVVVDVKSSENLNKFSFWQSKIPENCPVDTFYNILSDEEKQILAEI